jgi:signal transduction histidine kinase
MARRTLREFVAGRRALPANVLVLLTAAAVVPSAGVLWFMGQALTKERDAVRVQLEHTYQDQVTSAAGSMSRVWRTRRESLEDGVETLPAQKFHRAVTVGKAAAAIVLGERGQVLYPDRPHAPAAAPSLGLAWGEALWLERNDDPVGAAARYTEIAHDAASPNERARAHRERARCLAQAGRRDEALSVLLGPLADGRLAGTRDASGRLLVPDAMLRAVELAGDPSTDAHRRGRERLLTWLESYQPPLLAASQRRFLYEQLRELWPACPRLPLLEAEELAALYAEKRRSGTAPHNLGPGVLPGILALGSSGGRVIALYREADVAAELATLVPQASQESGVTFVLSPPGRAARAGVLASAPLGGEIGGWTLSLHSSGADPLTSAPLPARTAYVWAASLILATILAASLLAGRALGQQVRVTRLKNDLIATVSHEMRTPVASMRVLLDNLIDGDVGDPAAVREYLHLIRSENARLAALVESFLTFSRLERRRWSLERAEVRVDEVVQGAVDPLRERLQAPGCAMTVEVSPDLPVVRGDREALTTAVANLIENALKYSGDDKRIAVRARSAGGGVLIEVEDNGVGFSRREARRLFEPFYQADRRLSRVAGGCGLGLSIVKSIVEAHEGGIAARGEPGKGATFSITLPA